jgi:hypothetical protein
MKVRELRQMIAAIPEKFDDVIVVGNWGYECDEEVANGLEIDEGWGWWTDDVPEDYPRRFEPGDTSPGGPLALRFTT